MTKRGVAFQEDPTLDAPREAEGKQYAPASGKFVIADEETFIGDDELTEIGVEAGEAGGDRTKINEALKKLETLIHLIQQHQNPTRKTLIYWSQKNSIAQAKAKLSTEIESLKRVHERIGQLLEDEGRLETIWLSIDTRIELAKQGAIKEAESDIKAAYSDLIEYMGLSKRIKQNRAILQQIEGVSENYITALGEELRACRESRDSYESAPDSIPSTALLTHAQPSIKPDILERVRESFAIIRASLNGLSPDWKAWFETRPSTSSQSQTYHENLRANIHYIQDFLTSQGIAVL